MVAELILEKFKQHEREVGRQEERQQWQAWYERQQAAQRAGQPFTEPPPGHSDNGSSNNSP